MGKENNLVVPALNVEIVELVLVGDSPLISHRFSDKNKESMLAIKQNKKKQGREACDPEQEFKDSLYEIPGTPGLYGFPAMAFKLAAVRGAKSIPDLPMTDARGMFRIECENHMLIPLRYDELKMVEDVVRIGRGSSDLRYRGYFYNWETTVRIKYNSSVTRLETLIMMFDVAGFGVGVGDWRPEKGGMYGTFHVKKDGELL